MLKKIFLSCSLSLCALFIGSEEINIDLSFGDLVNTEFYTLLQFPQCASKSDLSVINTEDDYAGNLEEMTNKSDHRILERQSKNLREFQQQIIKLNARQEYKKLLQVSNQAFEFINDSLIFKQSFLRRYNPSFLGYFSLRGYRMDFLSALQYTTLSIVNSSLEAAKILQNEELKNKWANTGLKINRWIHKYRGCLSQLENRFDIGTKVKKMSNTKQSICHLNNFTESIFSESLSLGAMERMEYSEAIDIAALSLTAIQMTPESQRSFKSSALKRLNNLARLAYSANQENKWCLSYEGFDRAINLAVELDIEPLEVWQSLKLEASKNYVPVETAMWTTRYGMASKEGKPTYVPLRQIPPKYPTELLVRGIEGCAMLRFDITKEGKTENVEVVWSTNKKFDRPSRRAAKEYIFSPPYKGGVPSIVEDARSLIMYRVDSKEKTSEYIPPGCEANQINLQDL